MGPHDATTITTIPADTRSEPAIAAERKRYLDDLLAPALAASDGSAPFQGVKLSRADIEWLLMRVTAVQGRPSGAEAGPRARIRLDLRGADCHDAGGQPADLSELALTGADLRGAHLEGISFYRAVLDGADFTGAWLQEANLSRSSLRGATFLRARLQRADLSEVEAEGATFRLADLEGADLRLANMRNADLRGAHFEGADLRNTHFEGADLQAAHLEGKTRATAEDDPAGKPKAVRSAVPAADLSSAYFDSATSLEGVTLGNESSCAQVADVRWGGSNLAVVRWPREPILGDERAAWAEARAPGGTNSRAALRQFAVAVRANRQLAVVLREQGLNELADHFAYRAQSCQRKVLKRQGKQGARAWSVFLDLLAGYGYKPRRSFGAYLAVIVTFAALYLLLAPHAGVQLSPLGAVVFSMTSFHGRGFFPGTGTAHPVPLDNPLTVFAALEAVVGLIIEVSLIATFTQRFFGR